MAVSPVCASTDVLGTSADDLCSSFKADKAATKSIVKMVTVASASAVLLAASASLLSRHLLVPLVSMLLLVGTLLLFWKHWLPTTQPELYVGTRQIWQSS